MNDKNTILIVDDTPANIDILNELLKDFKRKVAINGKNALKIILSDNPPDLILLDIMMPEIDGYEVCKEVRKHPQYDQIPIIFLTAKTEKDDIVKGFQIGAQDYITKPFDPNELMARVSTHLKIKNQRKIIAQQNKELTESYEMLKNTQAQLVQNEKMASLGVLTAGIAHELNNPINFISAGIDALKMNYDDVSKVIEEINTKYADHEEIQKIIQNENLNAIREDNLELIEGIEEGLKRTIEIVRGLRIFSRLDESELKEASIADCLDSTIVLLSNKTKDIITIHKDYQETPFIYCFPGKLNQVFMNILMNAIQAIPDSGDIYIKLWFENHKVKISIRDNGIGIKKENINKIYEPFYTSKDVGEGTGLGLFISYGIIKKHHGSLNVISQEGVGTEFIISLPDDLHKNIPT